MVDSSSESDSDSPVVKKAKYAGAAKYKSKFNKDWIVKYPFVSSVTSDKSAFHCNVCNRTLSCVHQGEADLKRHMASDGHTALAKEQAKQPAITSFLKADLDGTTFAYHCCMQFLECALLASCRKSHTTLVIQHCLHL